jgi:hypothetical protein
VAQGTSGYNKNTNHYYQSSAAIEAKIIGKADLKDRVKSLKSDMRFAILDIQHELTVEGIERKMVDYTEDELKHLTVAHVAKHYPTPEWVHMGAMGSIQWVSCSWRR